MNPETQYVNGHLEQLHQHIESLQARIEYLEMAQQHPLSYYQPMAPPVIPFHTTDRLATAPWSAYPAVDPGATAQSMYQTAGDDFDDDELLYFAERHDGQEDEEPTRRSPALVGPFSFLQHSRESRHSMGSFPTPARSGMSPRPKRLRPVSVSGPYPMTGYIPIPHHIHATPQAPQDNPPSERHLSVLPAQTLPNSIHSHGKIPSRNVGDDCSQDHETSPMLSKEILSPPRAPGTPLTHSPVKSPASSTSAKSPLALVELPKTSESKSPKDQSQKKKKKRVPVKVSPDKALPPLPESLETIPTASSSCSPITVDNTFERSTSIETKVSNALSIARLLAFGDNVVYDKWCRALLEFRDYIIKNGQHSPEQITTYFTIIFYPGSVPPQVERSIGLRILRYCEPALGDSKTSPRKLTSQEVSDVFSYAVRVGKKVISKRQASRDR